MRALDSFINSIANIAATREMAKTRLLQQQAQTELAAMQLKMVKKIKNTGYGNAGASSMKTSLARYNYRGGSTEDDIGVNWSILAQRSRQHYMGIPIARGALNTHVRHVVGGGLQCMPMPDWKALGWSKEQAQEWIAVTKREYRLCFETLECSFERMYHFDELQQTAFLSALMSGDSFALLPLVPRDGVPYDLRIHLIEGDRVLNPFTFPITGYLMQVHLLPDGGFISGGIEFGPDGGVRCYHVAKWHPLTRQFTRNIAHWQKVNTFDQIEPYGALTGRRNILHLLPVSERPEQRRGVPLLATVIEDLLQLNRYKEAELMAAVVTSMMTVFIKSSTPQTPLGMSIPPGVLGGPTPLQMAGGDNNYELGSGSILSLNPDESIEVVDPKRPASGFQGFVQAICEQLGPALDLPYEVLLQHFGSSYSASRAALLMAWKGFMGRRQWMARRFNQPIYEEFLAEAVGMGVIEAPGFFDNPRLHAAYCRAAWHGPSMGSIQPKDEATAAVLLIDKGLSNRRLAAAELNGTDPLENLEVEAEFQEYMEELGLTETLVQPELPPAKVA